MAGAACYNTDVPVLTPAVQQASPGAPCSAHGQIALSELDSNTGTQEDLEIDWDTVVGCSTGAAEGAELDAEELGPWSGIAIKDQSNASAADLTDPLCTFDFPSTLSEFSTTPATAFADSPFSLSSLPTPATTADFPPTPALTPCTDFSPTPSTSASCDKPVRRPKVYWTAQEDELLMSTKEAPLNRKLSWVAIARKAGLGRTGKECRARYLILKDKRDLPTSQHGVAFRPAPRQRHLYSAADDTLLLSLILSGDRVDWSAVGRSLDPPRTGDNCYQRACKLRRMKNADERAREARDGRAATEVAHECQGSGELQATQHSEAGRESGQSTLEELGLAWLADSATEM